MDKKIGLCWIKDDFRINRNSALCEATKNHEQVVAFYLFKKSKFKKQEAQKWWVSNSLNLFKKKLNDFNINLQVVKTNTYKEFFDQLFLKKDYAIYWNKIYEPNYLKFDKYLEKNFIEKKIKFKIFKGNILNEIDEIKKSDGTPFKVFTPYWRNAEKYFIEKVPINIKKISKCKKIKIILKAQLMRKKFYLKKIGLKNLKNIGVRLKMKLSKN